jgi:hypothetical protein
VVRLPLYENRLALLPIISAVGWAALPIGQNPKTQPRSNGVSHNVTEEYAGRLQKGKHIRNEANKRLTKPG